MVWLLTGIVWMVSCAPVRFVKPLEKNVAKFQASVGGPMIGFAGTTIPIPFTNISGGYGITERLTGYGTWHTTAALFGVAQADMGVLYGLTKPKGMKPGISAGLSANLAYKSQLFRLWPQLDLNAYWPLRKQQDFCYINLNSWVELSRTRYLGEPQQVHFIPSLALGYSWSHHRWNYLIEYRRIAPFTSNQFIVVDYKWSGSHGATGLYFSVGKTIKSRKS